MKFDLESLEFVECDIDRDKLAISGSDRDLTWEEFKIEVERTKKKIESYNLPEGHPIVIYGHKEAQFLVTIVACIRLKMPYIPVDTIYPVERLVKISQIVKSALIINIPTNEYKLNKSNIHTQYSRKDQIIYIIFTSGSTGEPKGVQITKESILDFKIWLKNDFDFNEKKNFMNQAPFSFDLSVYEVVGFLLFGGTIILNDRETIENYLHYISRIEKYNCNIWISTPSFISKLLFSNEFNSEKLNSLDTFIFCGETLPTTTVKRIHDKFPNAEVINSYGPTEATVAISKINIKSDIIKNYSNNLPVGYIKKSTEVVLLNTEMEDGKLVGEIQIIGDNVSIGYFNNEQLNKKKFTTVNGKRAFNTGDYGYFEDGMLFFIGRKDDLVKLHGFRIEIDEIDNEIENQDGIKQSITVPLKRGSEVVKLITFINAEKIIDISDLKNKISTKLPYYMIPSDIIQLEEIPYNANHKVDKKKLIEIYKQK